MTPMTDQKTPRASKHEVDHFIESVRQAYTIDRALGEATGTRLIGSGVARTACCPFHEDRTPSLSVNTSLGFYKCHSAGCGAQGNVFTLLMSTYHMSFREAVAHAAQQVGMSLPEGYDITAAPVARRRTAIKAPSDAIPEVPLDLKPSTLLALPAEADLPRPGRWISAFDPNADRSASVRKFIPEMVHVYRNLDGQPIQVILRCLKRAVKDQKPGKFFIHLRAAKLPDAPPACRIKGAPSDLCWVMKGPAEAEYKPIYGAESLGRESVKKLLIVEGEKTADAVSRLLKDVGSSYAVLSPMGGGAAPLRMDWPAVIDTFREHNLEQIAIWPDADKLLKRPNGDLIDRQRKFSNTVLKGLTKALADAQISPSDFHICIVKPPEDRESGWDLADAEAEGWSGDDIISWIAENAYPADPDPANPGPGRPQGDTESSADATEKDPDDNLFGDVSEEESQMTRSLDEFDTAMALLEEQVSQESAEIATDLPREIVESQALPAPQSWEAPLEVEDGYPDLLDDHDDRNAVHAVLDNPYFRPLGFYGGDDYFISIESGYIYGLSAQMLRSNYLLKLARRDWWLRLFPKEDARGARTGAVDWEAASDALVAASHSAGIWDPARERGQGATIDEGRVVFNTGSALYVQGLGQVPIRDFQGANCYTMGISTKIPSFHNPFAADDPAIHAALEIVSSLNWKPEQRELSIMGLFGWMCIGPIAGILPWRPHLWLSGQRSAGKSWILRNIVARVLGDYAYFIKSNSTEPGIRRNLHAKSLPLIFDEAEGESRQDRERIDGIIRLARHSASDDNSVVMQAASGGGSRSDQYRIRSSFLFSSITPQLDSSADKTRFAHAHLDEGRRLEEFVDRIEGPAEEILTEEFSRRFIARMIMRAPDFKATHKWMIKALTAFSLERRIVDVYAAFAAGSWLMLRDGVPENEFDAYSFVSEVFNVAQQIQRFGQDVGEDKDHMRLFRTLQASQHRYEAGNMGQRSVSVGQMISAAAGLDHGESFMSRGEACAALKELGIRIGRINDPDSRAEDNFTILSEESDQPNCVVIHRNATPIQSILKETPYARNYSQVMLQASNVYVGKAVRFSSTLGVSRTIIVPLSIFSLGEGYEE